jgi:hypothetical protein
MATRYIGDSNSQSKIKGAADGVAPATGMIGETPGASATAGTGGSLYSKTSTTNYSAAAAVVSLTLNKGVYIVSGCTSFTGPAGGATNASIQLRIGGTAVTNAGNQFQTISASAEIYASTPAYPIVITADSTAVDLYCTCGGTGGTNTVNELCAVRIA